MFCEESQSSWKGATKRSSKLCPFPASSFIKIVMTDTPTRLLAAILETAAESIIAVNDHHPIIAFNKAAEKAFGYSAKEASGQPLDVLLPDRLVNMYREHIQKFADSADRSRPIADRPELVVKRKDGSEKLTSSLSPHLIYGRVECPAHPCHKASVCRRSHARSSLKNYFGLPGEQVFIV